VNPPLQVFDIGARRYGLSHGVGAGLFNLSAPFKVIGEPAPTGPSTQGGHGGTAPTKGRILFKVPLLKGDLGGSRLW